MKNKIILASNSKRRQELLKYIVEDFEIIVSDIDEEAILNETIKMSFQDNFEKYCKICENIALKKCEKVAFENKNSIIISADTVVYDEREIFGKPKDFQDAVDMLEYLSGKEHIVQTSFCIYKNGIFNLYSEKTKVIFNPLDIVQKKLIREYVENDKPYDKAGAYGIQDRGSLLIKKFNGDYFNVVGLPISRLNRILNELDIIGTD